MSTFGDIQRRRSVRTYRNEQISDNTYDRVTNILQEACKERTPFDGNVRLYLIKNLTSGHKAKFGTYGFIKDPQAFIAGVCKNNRNQLVNAGYVMEKTLLGMTGIGLATCWLGGTFKRKNFTKEITLNDGEIIPGVISIGYENRMNMKEKLIRRFSTGDRRYPLETMIFRNDFNKPVAKETTGLFAEPFDAVRMAPSASNKQPWRLIITENDTLVRFYLKKTPDYTGNFFGFEMQYIDIGIAVCHFSLVCEEKGIRGRFFIEDAVSDKEQNKYIISWKRI